VPGQWSISCGGRATSSRRLVHIRDKSESLARFFRRRRRCLRIAHSHRRWPADWEAQSCIVTGQPCHESGCEAVIWLEQAEVGARAYSLDCDHDSLDRDQVLEHHKNRHRSEATLALSVWPSFDRHRKENRPTAPVDPCN
jgi:hypothetical protein